MPSSSLVDVDAGVEIGVEVEVEVGVKVEVGFEVGVWMLLKLELKQLD